MADSHLKATDYTAGAVNASKAVMVELTHLLQEYRDNYPGGAEAVAAECRPHLFHGIVREGLGHIAQAFASPKATGPTWYARFIEADDLEEREMAAQDAYQQVAAFLESAGYMPDSEGQA